MNDSTKSQAAVRKGGGFSLASLALLVTACAVFLTAIDVDRCRQQLSRMWSTDSSFVIGIFFAAAIVGGLIGFFRLFFAPFNLRLLLFAPLAGCLVGVVAILVLIAPGPLWRSILAILLLLATVNTLRLGSE